MVSALAIGLEVRGFKPSWGDGFLKAIKICSLPSLKGEVKLETPCCKILRHVKITCKYEHKYCKIKFSFLSPIIPACYQMTMLVGLPESSGRWVRSFPLSTLFYHGFPCSYVTWRMNNWWLQFRDIFLPHRHDDDDGGGGDHHHHHQCFASVLGYCTLHSLTVRNLRCFSETWFRIIFQRSNSCELMDLNSSVTHCFRICM
jgi:hypothetical protein